MLIGYIRLSAFEEEDLEIHENELRKVGCRKIFTDIIRQKESYRPNLSAMFDYLREGDIVVVEEYKRLTRGVRDLLYVMQQINEKRADIKVLYEGLDTTTEEGFKVYDLLVSMGKYERQMAREKKMDTYFSDIRDRKTPGRKPVFVDAEMFAKLYRDFRDGRITRKMMTEELNVSLSTLKRYEKEYCKEHNLKGEL